MTYVYSKSEDSEIWQHTRLDDLIRDIVEEQNITEDTVLYVYRGKVKKQRVASFVPDLTEALADYAYDNFDEDYVDEWVDSIPKEELQKGFETFVNRFFKQRNIEPDVNHVVEIEQIAIGVKLEPKLVCIHLSYMNGK